MSFLTPAFLFLGLLALPIIVLYMLKLRRREVLVSSTLLWRMVLRDREANRPWQRLRRNLLLLLQLLLLAALVLALARPYLPIPVVATGQVTVLLDGSASMLATDIKPNRFTIAQEAALQIVDVLDSEGVITVILVGQQPEVLISASADKNQLREAIEKAEAFVGDADWESAVALASGAARNTTAATTVVISDGGLPDELGTLPGEVRYIPVGKDAANLGISALSVLPGGAGPQLFASITNYGPDDSETILSINADGELLNARRVAVPAGETVGINLALLTGRVIEARLIQPSDSTVSDNFALDDRAWTVYDPAQSGRVLYMAARDNVFVEQVLAVLKNQGDIDPYRILADQSFPTELFELYIFDGFVPEELPAADMLFINPPAPGNALLNVGAEFRPHLLSTIEVIEHPVTRFVDWNNVQFLSIHNVQPVPELETQFEIVARIDERPLMLVGEVQNYRIAVLTFDVRDSDLPLQISFPILFSNLINWLTPSTIIEAEGEAIRPGDSVRIVPDVASDAIAIALPNGRTFTAPVTESGVIFAGTNYLGLYTVSSGSTRGDGRRLEINNFAVNLFSQRESDIAPRNTISIGRTPIGAAVSAEIGQREFWPWLAAFGLLLLLVEWWAYHRGNSLPTVPGPRGWFRRRRSAA